MLSCPMARWLMLILLHPCEAVVDLLTGLTMPMGIALDLQAGRMYFAGAKGIRSATLDGDDLRDVVVKNEAQEAPRDVAIDPMNQKIYWTALCCGIRRADLPSGTNEEVIVSGNAEFASGIAFQSGYIYWADWMQGRILRHHLESGSQKAIVTGLTSPVNVAVDGDQIYWSDMGVGRIQRGSVSGSDVQFLSINRSTMNTYGLAVDPLLGKLYMTDSETNPPLTGDITDFTGRIIRTNLDGSSAEVLVSEPGMPYGVAVDAEANQVYWTDQRAGKMKRLTLMCQSGVHKVQSRMNSTVVHVPHGKILHGSSTTVSCPSSYTGTMTFACNDDVLTVKRGKCGKRCNAGAYKRTPDEKEFVLDHPAMDDSEDLTLDCPRPLAGTVQLRCQDGVVLLHGEKMRCKLPGRAR
eukprot:Skav220214  [mRNA]  locus=scaffold1600:58718:59941:- [translate_table: standard]